MTTRTQAEQMHAALYYEPGVVRYERTEKPIPGPGELVVAINTALTCGTDVKCYRRGHPVLLKHFPSPFGHEFAGVVAAVGEGVEKFQVGDRVVAANSAPCGECFYCLKNQPNLCESLDLLNGAYADFLKIPARIVAKNTYKIPDHVPFEAAAFAEPLAVSLRGVAVSGVTPGDHVAVMGLGPIGQLLVKAAKIQGAHVTAFARSPMKREMAQTFGGADRVVDLTQYTEAEAIRRDFTENGRGFDVVIEAIGRPHTWELAVDLVRKGGTVNLFGGCEGGTTITLDTRRLHYDEIKLISLFHHAPEYFQKAVALMADGVIDPRMLISDVMPMARFEEALQRMERGEALKIALKNGID